MEPGTRLGHYEILDRLGVGGWVRCTEAATTLDGSQPMPHRAEEGGGARCFIC